MNTNEAYILKKLRSERHPGPFITLAKALAQINDGAVGDTTAKNAGFIPDAAAVVEAGGETTLRLYEIENTSPLTVRKLHVMAGFANDLYDETGVYTEVWTVDGDTVDARKVYDVRGDIVWQTPAGPQTELEMAGEQPPLIQREPHRVPDHAA